MPQSTDPFVQHSDLGDGGEHAIHLEYGRYRGSGRQVRIRVLERGNRSSVYLRPEQAERFARDLLMAAREARGE